MAQKNRYTRNYVRELLAMVAKQAKKPKSPPKAEKPKSPPKVADKYSSIKEKLKPKNGPSKRPKKRAPRVSLAPPQKQQLKKRCPCKHPGKKLLSFGFGDPAFVPYILGKNGKKRYANKDGSMRVEN